MAINGNQYDPNNQNNGQQQQDNFMSQPVSISGSEAQGPATGAATGGNNAQATSNPKPTSSGRFQNLNAYLNANKNFNAQGGGLAGQVNQNLTSRSNDLQKNFAQAQQDYQTTLNNARQRYDNNFVDNTLKNPTGTPVQTGQNTGFVPVAGNTAPPAPTGLSDADVAKFQGMLNAQYTGPTSLDPNLDVQASNFSQLAGNTGSEQGRFNLLQNLYNKPTYSSGQRTLDNLMLQSNPQQIAALQGNKTTVNQLNNNLRQAETQAGIQATDATNEANATRDATRNALTGAVTGFDTNMQNSVQDALNSRDAAYQKELMGLQNTNTGISSDDANRFGLLGTLGDAKSMPIYNLDPGKYLQESTITPTGQTVASADDYNKIAALQKLSGGYGNEDISKVFDAYNDPTKAGSFAKENPYDFNTAGFTNDLNAVKSAYENEKNPQQVNYDQAYAALHGGDPNLHMQGGVLGEMGRESGTERDKLQQAYNLASLNAKNSGTTIENLYKNTPGGIPFNPTGASDIDVLKAAGSSYTKNNQTDPYGDLINRYNFENNKLTNSQQALDQLLNKYGANRYVGINDANKYQPTQVAPTNTPGQLPGGGDIMTALNSIYNR